jgi:hypothetical protein
VCGAAHVHDLTDPSDSNKMLWPTNYTKLATATMFTIFWAGDVFAPKTVMETGENIKDYLQRHYIASFTHLAKWVSFNDSISVGENFP